MIARNIIFLFVCLLALICAFFIVGHISADGAALRVHFFSVGYADSILLKFPKKNVLIDSGSKEYCGKLVQDLISLDIKGIDSAIITHPHDNHYGCFADIIDNFTVRQFIVNYDVKNADSGYRELFRKVIANKIPVRAVKAGDVIFSDKGYTLLAVLSPDILSDSTNDNSLVTWLRYKDTSFLFTGDISPKTQDIILKKSSALKYADCVQVPHHGGEISQAFIKSFRGKIFVVSTGKNKYGLPLQTQLEELSGEVLRTDQKGDITLESDGKKVRLVYD
ncbi:MAG: MBL fold metallo-hydrolase [Candidatus Omnitrophica bacterium]|nr:MBL fold metallo-hydrolase [Candidatus Omnitrophota bacterium]